MNQFSSDASFPVGVYSEENNLPFKEQQYKEVFSYLHLQQSSLKDIRPTKDFISNMSSFFLFLTFKPLLWSLWPILCLLAYSSSTTCACVSAKDVYFFLSIRLPVLPSNLSCKYIRDKVHTWITFLLLPSAITPSTPYHGPSHPHFSVWNNKEKTVSLKWKLTADSLQTTFALHLNITDKV